MEPAGGNLIRKLRPAEINGPAAAQRLFTADDHERFVRAAVIHQFLPPYQRAADLMKAGVRAARPRSGLEGLP